VKPVQARPVREKGVSVLDELLGIMLTEGNAVDKIIRAVTERQRQMRENGFRGAGENSSGIKILQTRPDKKVGITMNEHFDIEELKKDPRRRAIVWGSTAWLGYAC